MSQFTQFRIWIGPHVFTHRIPLDYYSNDNIEWAHSIIGHSVIFLSHATMWNAHANFSKFENFSSEVMKAICRLDWLRSTNSKRFVWKCGNSCSNIPKNGPKVLRTFESSTLEFWALMRHKLLTLSSFY